MIEEQSDWRLYEKYTKLILKQEKIYPYLKKYYNIGCQEYKLKEKLKGKRTGTTWEIDVCGYTHNLEPILFECKHYGSKRTKSRQIRKDKKESTIQSFQDNTVNQNTVAAFAYIIKDVEAHSGIIVTTCGFQAGAVQVARAENIGLIVLHYDSTNKHYFIRFDSATQEIETRLSEKIEGTLFETVGLMTDEVKGFSGSEYIRATDYSYLFHEAIKILKEETGRDSFEPFEINEKVAELIEPRNDVTG